MSTTRHFGPARETRAVRFWQVMAIVACASAVTALAGQVAAAEIGTISLLCAGLLAMGAVRLGRAAWMRNARAVRSATACREAGRQTRPV